MSTMGHQWQQRHIFGKLPVVIICGMANYWLLCWLLPGFY